MHIISEQINGQVRRVFDDNTPLQLLKMDKTQRKVINDFKAEHDQNPYRVQLKGLEVIFIGNKVRFLTWTRKEQMEGKKKGYSEKWSRRRRFGL